ncbi:hypothetical protein SVIOM74S_08346 [Streptomyces violarus]
MTRTESSGRPNTVESSSCVPYTHWVLSHTVSRLPSQRAMVACGSIGLWWLRARRYVRSSRTSASRRPASASPRAYPVGSPGSPSARSVVGRSAS